MLLLTEDGVIAARDNGDVLLLLSGKRRALMQPRVNLTVFRILILK